MKNIFKRISLHDLIPPIVIKVLRKVNTILNNKPLHPFDAIPLTVRPNWYLDVGANVGDVTRKALKSYPQCQAICFEPVSETYKVLKQNLMSFDGRCHFFNMGLSNKKEEVEINITSFHGANSILKQSELHKRSSQVIEIGKEKIQLVTLDDISKEFPTKKIDIMKIDVEGFELEVFKGLDWDSSLAPEAVLMECQSHETDDMTSNYVNNIFEFMKSAGFSLINIYDLEPISGHPNLLLGQADFVFRRNSNLK